MENGKSENVVRHSLLTGFDVYLFRQGRHFRIYEKLGAHRIELDGTSGTHFAVWAPNAQQVEVIGDFNSWSSGSHPLFRRDDGSGIWEGFIPGVKEGNLYKYRITSSSTGLKFDKGDPFALSWEVPPRTASIVYRDSYEWGDLEWMNGRQKRNALDSPFSIYEVHLGSWKMKEGGRKWLEYTEVADGLSLHLSKAGFTHVELMPVMEHPFYGSWGYQTTGYFAPTSRYGSPEGFKRFVDKLHRSGIGVILDWVPSHFPADEHGLAYFDGTHLYEYEDPRKGFHPDWKSYIFDYGKGEVRSFLVSNALFWLDKYHADGLRVDAVASMIYLDYSRKDGEWVPNEFGGKENLEAISFIRTLNEAVYSNYPDVQVIAEESTAWPMVSRPTYLGGLGFGMKWNMGWMHDVLGYFSLDPIFRKYHHDKLTFSIWYAWSENFVLSLSHDEVVYGKRSLLSKMPGDEWQKFANMRLLLGYMFAHPGKKLLFMGGEFGQWHEWSHERGLDWGQLDRPLNSGLFRWVSDLNKFYRGERCLWEADFSPSGFQWVDFRDWEASTISFLRKSGDGDLVLAAFNFTPVPRFNYVVGVPRMGTWREVLNSDAQIYGGSGLGNLGKVEAKSGSHGMPHSLSITLPPLGCVYFKSPKAHSGEGAEHRNVPKRLS
uniref:1,4-alpha-glucan branching enzyme n=1 Tax=Candidatus Methanomethylicus mesodigestus TaxID=1867258 RepID=A0A7C3J3R3_9CREN